MLSPIEVVVDVFRLLLPNNAILGIFCGQNRDFNHEDDFFTNYWLLQRVSNYYRATCVKI